MAKENGRIMGATIKVKSDLTFVFSLHIFLDFRQLLRYNSNCC